MSFKERAKDVDSKYSFQTLTIDNDKLWCKFYFKCFEEEFFEIWGLFDSKPTLPEDFWFALIAVLRKVFYVYSAISI